MEMKFRVVNGKKGDNDQVIYIKTDGWEKVTYEDFFKLTKLLLANEERIYPPPRFKGAQYLIDAILMLKHEPVEDVLVKFKVKHPTKLHHFLI